MYIRYGSTVKMLVFNWLLDILDNHEISIKFEATLNKQKIDFLDITLFKDPANQNGLLTKIFFKPTDTGQLLYKDSFHPKHTFKKSWSLKYYVFSEFVHKL